MIIKFKFVASLFLALSFVMGLVQEIGVNDVDDTSIVMEWEHPDSPNDSEPDMDEDALDFDSFLGEILLPVKGIKGGQLNAVSYIDRNFQALKSALPTPPPEDLA